MSEEIKQEYGWRILPQGEPFKNGDEFWRYEEWTHPCTCSMCRQSLKDIPRRRRIDPGEGFEIVPYGAIINEGDQRFIDGEWREFIYSIGKPIRTFHAVRRPIPRLSASPWVKFSERLPEAHKPIWVLDPESTFPPDCYSSGVIDPSKFRGDVLWQYATIPTPPTAPPPAPKRTPEAEAFELWEGQTINDSTRSFQTAFLAGAHWARREGV